MICKHLKNNGYSAMPLPDEGPFRFCYDLWVCNQCHLPTRMVFEKLTHNYIPKNATHLASVVSEDTGRCILTWATKESGVKVKTMVFHPYPRKADMDQGRNILVEMWRWLDRDIDTIRGNPGHDMEHDKTHAMALAETIALLMAPFYADSKAVLAESMNRWTARQEGREHESPGLAESIWDPATRFDGTPYSRESEAKVATRTAPVKPKVIFDDTKIKFIKHCIDSGAQTAKVLAGMFQCAESDIQEAYES